MNNSIFNLQFTIYKLKKWLSLATFLILFVIVQSCKTPQPVTIVSTPKSDTLPKYITTSSGLQYIITHKGEGEALKSGDKVEVNYTGKLVNGNVFDKTPSDGNSPYLFILENGKLMKGWEEAMKLLHVGDKAILRFPPELGYGKLNLPNVPPNSTLIFEVEVLKILD